MQRSIVVAVCLAVMAAVAAPAQADMTQGKLVSLNAKQVVLKKGKKKVGFSVTKDTMCGVSYGQMGDAIACKTLRKKKYVGRTAFVTWEKTGGKRVAQVLSVDLSKK